MQDVLHREREDGSRDEVNISKGSTLDGALMTKLRIGATETDDCAPKSTLSKLPTAEANDILGDNELEVISKVRVSRRTSAPPINRERSKTPIMGDSVPRLSRHNSEEILLPRGRRSFELRKQLSSDSLLLPIDTKNHHRTASLRRKREKRKKKQLLKQKRKSKGKLNLKDIDNNNNNGMMSDEGTRDDLTGASDNSNIPDNNMNDVDLDVAPPAAVVNNNNNDNNEGSLAFYKDKCAELEKKYKELELKFAAKENEILELKKDFQNMIENEIANNLLDDIDRQLAALSSDDDQSAKESSVDSQTNKRQKRIEENELPQADTCVLFGNSLF